MTEVCNNTIGSYIITCKEGLERKATTQKCEDIDECSQDAGYVETVQKIKEMIAGKKPLPKEWQNYFVKPANETSAYGLCYNKAMHYPAGAWRWTNSKTKDAPLPWCENTAWDQKARYFEKWRGFECTCPPGDTRSINANQELFWKNSPAIARQKNEDSFHCKGNLFYVSIVYSDRRSSLHLSVRM
jgi:hypothetical protein